MTHEEMIEIIKAERDGKKLQVRPKASTKWINFHEGQQSYCQFNFYQYEYRVKPEPRVIWVSEYDTGLSAMNHKTKQQANNADAFSRTACRKFVEVEE